MKVAGGGSVYWMRGKDAELLLVAGVGGHMLVSRVDVPYAPQLLKFQPVQQQQSKPPPLALFVVRPNGDAATERLLPAVEYHKKEGKVSANVVYGRVVGSDSGSGSGSPCMIWREVVRQVLGVYSLHLPALRLRIPLPLYCVLLYLFQHLPAPSPSAVAVSACARFIVCVQQQQQLQGQEMSEISVAALSAAAKAARERTGDFTEVIAEAQRTIRSWT